MIKKYSLETSSKRNPQIRLDIMNNLSDSLKSRLNTQVSPTYKSIEMKRRESIKLINALMMGLPIRPMAGDWMTVATGNAAVNEIESFAKRNNIECFIEAQAVQRYAKDFGNIYSSNPQAALLPDSLEKLKAIVSFVNEKKLAIVPRGAGHSQSGQSLPVKDGVTVDLRKFNKVEPIVYDSDSATISCTPGATLRQVSELAFAAGYILPVLPMYLELTIGGVLSAGGIGTAAHQHGLLISNVAELEVLKADGSVATCTSTRNSELFNSVLGTSGRFGIITKARLKLVRSKGIFRSIQLLYKNIDEWLQDYRFLLTKDISNLQGACIRSKEGPEAWNFVLQVSLQADNGEGFDHYKDILSTLKFNSQGNPTDFTPMQFLDRYKSRFEQMNELGKFAQYHPIVEFIISADKAKQLIEKALQVLPPAFEDGFRLIYLSKKDLPDYFMVPEAEQLCMFAVLPTGIEEKHLEDCLNGAKILHEYAMGINAKRYLSGWVGMMNQEDFKNHYGNKAKTLVALKMKLDPQNIFRSLFAEKFFG